MYLVLPPEACNNPSTPVPNGMHFLGMLDQITFSENPLVANPHTALHRAREGKVVVDATHMICVLTFSPKGTLLLRTVGQSAEKFHCLVVGVSFSFSTEELLKRWNLRRCWVR